MNLFLKYGAYAFVLILYAIFAWAGKVPADGFIAVLTGVIAALGGSQATAFIPKTPPVPPAAPTPPAIPPTAPSTSESE